MPISTPIPTPLDPNSKTLSLVILVDDQGSHVIKDFSTNINNDMKSVEKQTTQTTNTIQKHTLRLSEMSRGFIMLGRQISFVTAATIGGIVAATKGVIDYSSTLWNMQQQTSVSTETLSSLSLAAQKSGTSIGQLSTSLRFLNIAIDRANTGNKAYANTFEKLGINIYDSNKKVRESSDILMELADKFKGMEDGAKKSSLAMQIFGRSGMTIIPFLNLGKKGLQENVELAKKLGLVIGKDLAQAADEYQGHLIAFKSAMQGVAVMISNYVLPTLTNLFKGIVEGIKKFKEWRDENTGLMKALSDVGLKIVLVTSFIGPLLLIGGRLILMFSQLKVIIMQMAPAIISGLTGPLGLATVAIAAIGVSINQLVKNTKEAKHELEMLASEAKIAQKSADELFIMQQAMGRRAVLEGGKAADQLLELTKKYGRDTVKILAEIETNSEYALLKKFLDDINKYMPEYEAAVSGTAANLNKEIKLSAEASKALGLEVKGIVDLSNKLNTGSVIEVISMATKSTKLSAEEVEKLRLGIKAVSEDTKNSFAQLGVAWKEDIYERIKDIEGALKDQNIITQALSESYKKLNSEVANYKMSLGMSLTTSEAFFLALGMGLKTVDEQRKMARYLSQEVEALQIEFKKGTITEGQYALGMKNIADQAAAVSPQLASLAEQASYGWQKAKGELSGYIENLNTIVVSMRSKKKEFEEFNKSLIEGFKEQSKSRFTEIKKLTEGLEGYINSFYAKSVKIDKSGQVIESIRKMGIELQKQIMGAEIDLKKAYDEAVKSVDKYYDNEKKRFEEILAHYDAEAELIKSLAMLRITAGAAQTQSELQEATAQYENMRNSIKDTYYKIIEDNRTAAKNQLADEKKLHIDPLIKYLEQLRNRSVLLEDDKYKKFKELQSKHKDWTVEQYAQALNIEISTAREMMSGFENDTTNNFQHLSQLLKILASEMADDFGNSMTDAEYNLVHLVNSFGSLSDAIGIATKNGAKSFKDFASAATASLGDIGAALGGLIGGSAKNYGTIGAGIGASIGGIFGPVGGAIGSLLGGLVGGIFKKKKSEEEKAAEAAKKDAEALSKIYKGLGEVSVNTAARINELAKTLGKTRAELLSLSSIMNDTGISYKNFNMYAEKMVQLLKQMSYTSIGQVRESLAQMKAEFGNAFNSMLGWLQTVGNEGEKSFIKLIRAVRESGQEISEVNDYVNSWLGQALGGLQGVISNIAPASSQIIELKEQYDAAVETLGRMKKGTDAYVMQIKLVNELQRQIDKLTKGQKDSTQSLEIASRQMLVIFNSIIAQGGSMGTAIDAISDSLSALLEKYEVFGKEVPESLKPLEKVAKLKKDHEELFYAIEGNLQILKALGNTGFLTADSLKDVALNTSDYFKQLTDYGIDSKTALAMIAPTLSDLEWYAKQYGLTLDDATLSLIKQAKEAGVYKEHAVDLIETLNTGFKSVISKMDELIEAFTGRRSIKTSFETINEVGEKAFNSISSVAEKTYRSIHSKDWSLDIPVVYSGGKFGKEAIYGQSGGEWYVGKSSQVFVAHRGETVKIDKNIKDKNSVSDLMSVLVSELKKIQSNEVIFNISTLDADSVKKVVETKIAPVLMDMSKKETFVISPRSVRG